jgi:hypothetical protein
VDLLALSGTTLKLNPCTGSGLGPLVDTGVPFAAGSVALVMDFDDDGLDDAATWQSGGGSLGITYFKHNSATGWKSSRSSGPSGTVTTS